MIKLEKKHFRTPKVGNYYHYTYFKNANWFSNGNWMVSSTFAKTDLPDGIFRKLTKEMIAGVMSMTKSNPTYKFMKTKERKVVDGRRVVMFDSVDHSSIGIQLRFVKYFRITKLHGYNDLFFNKDMTFFVMRIKTY